MSSCADGDADRAGASPGSKVAASALSVPGRVRRSRLRAGDPDRRTWWRYATLIRASDPSPCGTAGMVHPEVMASRRRRAPVLSGGDAARRPLGDRVRAGSGQGPLPSPGPWSSRTAGEAGGRKATVRSIVAPGATSSQSSRPRSHRARRERSPCPAADRGWARGPPPCRRARPRPRRMAVEPQVPARGEAMAPGLPPARPRSRRPSLASPTTPTTAEPTPGATSSIEARAWARPAVPLVAGGVCGSLPSRRVGRSRVRGRRGALAPLPEGSFSRNTLMRPAHFVSRLREELVHQAPELPLDVEVTRLAQEVFEGDAHLVGRRVALVRVAAKRLHGDEIERRARLPVAPCERTGRSRAGRATSPTPRRPGRARGARAAPRAPRRRRRRRRADRRGPDPSCSGAM